jgi:KilA-N domain.
MKENGYVNATKICSDANNETGSKKPIKNWCVNSNTKALLKEVAS